MQRVAEEPSLAATALRYANLGIPVFPCVPGKTTADPERLP